jgi:hypothetical protein
LSDGDFADELRAAASTITKKRAKKPGDRLRDGCAIIETDFDAEPHIRAYLWLGICPKTAYCRKIGPASLFGGPAVTPPEWSFDATASSADAVAHNS